jgi:hypothetical protein
MSQPDETKTEDIGKAPRSGTFSIKSFLVLVSVFAATGVSLGHLYRAANGGGQGEVGQFIILTAMLPMIVLVGASWFFKIFGTFIK